MHFFLLHHNKYHLWCFMTILFTINWTMKPSLSTFVFCIFERFFFVFYFSLSDKNAISTQCTAACRVGTQPIRMHNQVMEKQPSTMKRHLHRRKSLNNASEGSHKLNARIKQGSRSDKASGKLQLVHRVIPGHSWWLLWLPIRHNEIFLPFYQDHGMGWDRMRWDAMTWREFTRI